MSCCVGLEVSQDEVGICSVAALRIQKRIVQIAESLSVIRRILTIDQLHQDTADILVVVEVIHRIVAAMILIVDNLAVRSDRK